MEIRINLRALNIFLISTFCIITYFVIQSDLTKFEADGGTPETFRFWYLSTIHIPKIVNMIVSIVMVAIFFYIAYKYNQLRNKEGDKYLSNMILYSAIYQAFSRAFEAYYMISESDLYYFIYVSTKYYMPLDILSVCFLTIVAITGFLNAESVDPKNKFLNGAILFIGLGGTIIGIMIPFFAYFTYTSLFILITTGVGIFLLFVMLVLIARTCYNIFHSWSKMPPFVVMGFQLILGMLHFFPSF